MSLLNKSREDDLETIESSLDKQSAAFAKVWQKYVKDIKSDESLKIIIGFLEENRDDKAIQYINSLNDDFNEIFLLAFLAGATLEVGYLSSQIIRAANKLKTTRTPLISIGFDSTNYYTNQILQSLTFNFKNELATSQAKLINTVVAQARSEGMNNRNIAKYLIDNLGMTQGQYEGVLNYERLLRSGNRQAFDRTLRDKRYDRTIERSIKTQKPLTEDQIKRMVAAYRRRYIRSRAETISRTTSKAIVESGRAEAARQMLEKAGLQPGDLVKQWRSRKDKKVRFTHTHASLDDQVVRENEYFISASGARLMYPGDPSAPLKEIANCRCRLLRYVKVEDRT